jgi:hypothetical protein
VLLETFFYCPVGFRVVDEGKKAEGGKKSLKGQIEFCLRIGLRNGYGKILEPLFD